MPGMWIRRDPESGQIWQELTGDEMSAHIRQSNPNSPEYLPHVPDDSIRMIRIDQRTVGVHKGGVVESAPFRWEVNLYEGWYESGHAAPALSILAGAEWMGCSMVDYLCAPGSATAHAQRMVAIERSAASVAYVETVSALIQWAEHVQRDDALAANPVLSREAAALILGNTIPLELPRA